MSRGRRSLRDFDDEAIVGEPPAGPEPAADPAPAPGSTKPRATTRKASVPKRTPAVRAATATTTRIGFYFHPETFEEAKSAYLVDLDDLPDAPDSFARWIAGTITEYAAKTTAERAAAAAALPEETREGSGFTRSFELSASAIGAMNAAISTDRKAHRVVTRSQFTSEAIRVAIADARSRAGGVLAPAPARLPNRPVR